ncbi:XRE family transcriptional regulator [Pelistega indica]|uniref:XRE family transcriptional regulator n=1 Tax=Pelistega indica TaxID=1414851 RepID=V8FWC2_9BURK|nr:helix-turn-helix transcriptional regulator [Pelistega indica]ETD67737.1 XRE family transcriptional regulator [Pelistega indica]
MCDDNGWVSIPVIKGNNDNETIPNEVVNIMVSHDISLLGAWRLYRGLSQSEVANKTGLTQSAISQAEKQSSKPQMKTLERLAKVYNCRPSQLYIDE